VSRWTGSWLSGPGVEADSDADDQQWRGERLGLPADGPGSVAGFGRRLGAIFVDWLPCAIAAQLLTTNPGISALAIFALLTVVSVTAFGRTPGHAVAGIRVAMLDGARPGFGAAVIRTVLLCLAVPALITNVDGRGLHDRASGTVVVHTR
jgi:uncharacterized RDD family membrane protein YckC